MDRLKKVIDKLTRWFIFSVLLSLVPISFSIFRINTRNIGCSFSSSLQDAISQGSLLLLAAILCAKALGEIISSSPTLKLVKTIASGGSVIILMFSSLYFAEVTSMILTMTSFDSMLVIKTSLNLFIASFVCSASCIALSEI